MGITIKTKENIILKNTVKNACNCKPNNKLLLCCCLLLPFSAVSPAFADESCIAWTDDFKNKPNLIVGKVEINAADVFDLNNPKESKTIHRVANNLHVSTKPVVIRRQLLFKEGEIFQPRKLSESERIVRSNRYIQDADIMPSELCGNRVNIQVNTTDKWTLSPGVSFSQSGGNSKTGFEIQEHNLLGSGKGLVVGYKSDEERDETFLSYTNSLFLGTRQKLYASVQDNSDGKGHEVDLSLPFFELDSRKAWGLSTSSLSEETSLYDKGDVSSKVSVKKSEHSAYWGWSDGLESDDTDTDDSAKNEVTRYKVGWKYTESDYKDYYSLTESYPWFEYEHDSESYTTRTNFKSMGEVEDITLGTNYTLGVGLLREEFGSTDNQLNLNASFEKGYEFENSLAFINMEANSYIGSGELEGDSLNLQAEWYLFDEHGSDIYLSGTFKYQSNLQPDEQLLLGGDTGLRAYPKGYESGDKSLVFTAEKRYHFDWYPLHLAKFGAAVFADVGSAWGDGKDLDVLADVGVGLRMIPTRSSITKAIHIDLAFPLNGDSDVDDVQLSVNTENSF
ncbi:hypothetical protein EV695_3158 [Cocleimonas flava]|uniref:Surface antigen-like protein n=1 Tax=Cocleimonas flava TaxID=634765 RepID=A0A4R1F451_9GAMM|nr:hypothetical protein EV695_3158 [Cocleimonas flava]